MPIKKQKLLNIGVYYLSGKGFIWYRVCNGCCLLGYSHVSVLIPQANPILRVVVK